MLSTLEARDAKHEITEMKAPSESDQAKSQVRKVLSEFRHLPHELRIEVMTQLGITMPSLKSSFATYQ